MWYILLHKHISTLQANWPCKGVVADQQKSNCKEMPVGAEITQIKSDEFEENYIWQY